MPCAYLLSPKPAPARTSPGYARAETEVFFCKFRCMPHKVLILVRTVILAETASVLRGAWRLDDGCPSGFAVTVNAGEWRHALDQLALLGLRGGD